MLRIRTWENCFLVIEDVALIECEPTLGKGKEAFLMVRHVKFGPSKKGGAKKKKTKAVEKTSPDAQKNGSDDASGVTSQVDIPTVPRRASSQSDISDPDMLNAHLQERTKLHCPHKSLFVRLKINTENNELRNPYLPTRRMDNRGLGMREPHTSYQRIGTSTPPFSPVREPRQAQTNASLFRNSNPPPNDIPKQELSSPSAPRTPGLGFGIFSNPKGDAPARQGVLETLPSNSNLRGLRSDSSQRPSTGMDNVGQRGFGIFSKESSSDTPNKTPKPN